MNNLSFLYPYALLAIAALPIIYFISKIAPPRPQKINLPSFALLKGINSAKNLVNNAPWWLKLLRILGLLFLVIGIASPIFNAKSNIDNAQKRFLIVIDDGFTNANNFDARKQKLMNYIRATQSQSGQANQITILRTSLGSQQNISVKSDIQAYEEIDKIEPLPIFTDFKAINALLAKYNQKAQIICLCDKVAHPNENELLTKLGAIAEGKIYILPPENDVAIINNITETNIGYRINISALSGNKSHNIDFYDKSGKIITSANVTSGANVTIPNFQKRNIYFAKIAGQNNSGATRIINIFNNRPPVGIEKHSFDLPLLSDETYIQAATALNADIISDSLDKIIIKNPAAIIYGDRGAFTDDEAGALDKYIQDGGMLIRFAGPQLLAANESRLLPQKLRPEPKILSGNFTWSDKGIDTSDAQSPLYGLKIGDDAQINRMAVFSGGNGNAEIWAMTKDKTPFISARKIGNGYVVLVHTGLVSNWSNLALSKYLYQIIDRILIKAQNIGLPTTTLPPSQPLLPIATIDGSGKISDNPTSQESILPDEWSKVIADANHPPGIYSGGGSTIILNMTNSDFVLKPFNFGTNYSPLSENDINHALIKPIFLLAGIVLLLVEMIITLFWGKLGSGRKRIAQSLAILAIFSINSPLKPLPAFAQNHFGFSTHSSQTDDLVIAYMQTNDSGTNQIARQGLEELRKALTARTSVEPAAVKAVNPEKDDLALYPVIYWLLPDRPQALSPKARAKINYFLANGGMLFVDTRGGERDSASASRITKIALEGLRIPPLEQVPGNHVLNKTFYLLRSYPARFGNANVWVENRNATDLTANDGVSPIIITDGDFASVWKNGAPSQFTMDTMDLRREIAFRFGINVYMYALTGQYKNDQVHIPLLLERLRSQGR